MRVTRGALSDIFEHGNESVVMAGSNVVRLSELATFLVGGLTVSRTSDELAAMLVDQFGEPVDADARDLVERMLSQLAALEIVEIDL
ncbi:hypothetical protein J2X11_001012 [Aeromicrobium panaciterrae]|uniref:PqqD family protein n=1 Tax=Aeromicrobium panaciterrae TaxID=363861 RepID=A0ABU1ULZ2_9ACTN|nr:PqqD family peptide modification chaperone [Aeromicrobium panaciterrae]MDR7086173.1 hypothetical protein [Aeromicrobium panaciterrae]